MGAPLLKGVALLGVRFEIWTSSSLFPLVLVLDRWQANRCSQRRQCSSFGYSSAIAEYRTCFIVFFFLVSDAWEWFSRPVFVTGANP